MQRDHGSARARARLLPAQVEIALAAGETEEADRACRELEQTAAVIGRGVPEAIAAQARGAVLLAEGDAAAALVPLRRALEVWQAIAAPYETARVRVLIGLACRALGRRGRRRTRARRRAGGVRRPRRRAGPRPGRCHRGRPPSGRAPRPDPRELQVLRLVSAGKTNGAIAAELFLSERTIERHLSNIFTKLDLSTRAAATAWAYEHGLI